MSIEKHGIIKSALLTLGLAHLHSNGDIIIPRNWEGLLEGLGLINESGVVNRSVDSADHIEDRLGRIKRAKEIVGAEGERLRDLERRRGVARVRATTVAMQEGKGTLETEAIGDRASEEIQDSGPADAAELRKSVSLIDDHIVDGALWLVRKVSSCRWEDSATCRIGARMGRPEKSGVREMKPMVHSLYPIAETGGPQRLLGESSSKGSIRAVSYTHLTLPTIE